MQQWNTILVSITKEGGHTWLSIFHSWNIPSAYRYCDRAEIVVSMTNTVTAFMNLLVKQILSKRLQLINQLIH